MYLMMKIGWFICLFIPKGKEKFKLNRAAGKVSDFSKKCKSRYPIDQISASVMLAGHRSNRNQCLLSRRESAAMRVGDKSHGLTGPARHVVRPAL